MRVDVVEVAPGVHHARAKHVSWVLVTDGTDVTLVDSGYPGDRARVAASLEAIGRSPADLSAILLTHGHPDHIGSVEHLRRVHRLPVRVHEREVANARGQRIEQVSEATLLRMLWRPDVMVWLFDVLRLKGARPERLRDLEPFTAGRLDVPGAPVAVPTPGHTSGHTSFHLPDRGALLVGDALMTGHALARQSGPQLLPAFFNTDTAQARASLERLRGLAAEVVVPGHGPAFHGSPDVAVRQALDRSPR
ncbi:MBL fold metallo-hydrolase [Planosporangium thailandense]|uniref:MBL fold metallo-hydrolase n=1 Tax=Planosporangium thailandense TaxID=765197 RepID=A0ABX0Y7D5_9ACTN|nr:MBL fold metallo-hydrolase [Planosporangium thailandense]NJC74263.1 MBL fold metallo-hydrolase [Planosporangium thailandense]